MLKIKKLPKRKPDSNKGDFGKVLIIAGSAGLTGAAVLAARGCLRVGAGLTYLAVPKELVNFVDSMTPEVITLPFEKIKSVKPDVIAIGPGLGVGRAARNLLLSVFGVRLSALILDADGLNNISENPKSLREVKNLIITPHPGEMSRLIKQRVADIQKNRVKVAKETAERFNCVVVLKGYRTVVADAAGNIYINNTGNPGLASGGVGDVLTGMIAGLAGQGLSPFAAAATGVYLHGLAGDLAAKEKGEYGLIASDLVEMIPYAIRQNN